jgi:hypothetical protein
MGDNISRTVILPYLPGLGLFFVFMSHPLYRITLVMRNDKPGNLPQSRVAD